MWLGGPASGWWSAVGVVSALVLLVDEALADRRGRRQHDGP
jgi:hypothetical protein